MDDHTQQHVVLINRWDQTIGLANKQQAHEKGWLHRAFSIFLFREKDEKWQTLLQQRALNKYHFPGRWTNACCSHPPLHQPWLKSAERRLEHEMGCTTSLKPLGHFIYQAHCEGGLIEHELDHVAIGFFDDEIQHYNREEVMATQWIEIEYLERSIKHNPSHYTPWLEKALCIAKEGL